MSPLPVWTIGGYLGAGKTTLLNALLSSGAGCTVVLVNDFGSVNVDANLIALQDGETIELSNGCACCTIGDDLAHALAGVAHRRPLPDRVAIEASGVADPRRLAARAAAVLDCTPSTLVVADASSILERAEDANVGDLVQRQIAGADAIYLSKLDLVTTERENDVRAWLKIIAPNTPIVATLSELSFPLCHPERSRGAADLRAPHDAEFVSTTIRYKEPVDRQTFEAEARAMAVTYHRAKGFVTFADDPQLRYVFQLTGERWSLEPCARGERGEDAIVAIAPRSGMR